MGQQVFGATQKRGGSPVIPFLAIAGMVLSAGIFLHMRDAARNADQALFERQAVQFRNALEDRFERQQLLLDALRGLFAGGAMTQEAFVAAVAPMRPLIPEVTAVGWVRHLSGPEAPTGAAAGPDEDQFIVSYLEPRDVGRMDVGLDLATLDGHRAVLETACTTGATTAALTPPGTAGQMAARLILFTPVFGGPGGGAPGNGVPAGRGAGCSAAAGHLMAEIRSDTLIAEAFRGQRPARGDVYVRDAGVLDGPRILTMVPASERALPPSPLSEADLNREPQVVQSLSVGGRMWEVVLVPQHQWLAPGELAAWGLLVVGLLLTALLTAYLRREARAKALLQTEARARAAMARMLRDSEERFRLALRHSRVSLFSQDRELRYVWVYNPQVGIPIERFIGCRHADLFRPDDAAVLDAVKRPVLESGAGTRQEVRVTVGGRTTVLDLVIEPLRDDTGAVAGIICASIDITESTQIKEALAEAHAEAESANQAKSRFLAAASHDLRQPFQAMSLFHHILMARLEDPKQMEVAGKLGEALAAGNALLTALLDTSALEAGTVKPRIAEFAFQDVAERLSIEIADQAAGKGIAFRMVPTSAAVRSDPVLLERMVRNLLVNALRYTERGSILLGCRRRGGSLLIEVWDTGPGIPEDQLQRIFEDFYRCARNRSDNTGGLGLGLSIVRRMAQILDHQVAVRSRLGQGTVFSIAVPLSEPGPCAAAPAALPVTA